MLKGFLRDQVRNGLPVLTAIIALAGAVPVEAQPQPATVAGKIVSVSHEKAQVNAAWVDKLSVTVDSCATPGSLVTVSYLPATVSDRTALGHLFDEDLNSARTMDNRQQNMANGYGLFWVDANKHVTRTGILGAKVDCSTVPQLTGQF